MEEVERFLTGSTQYIERSVAPLQALVDLSVFFRIGKTWVLRETQVIFLIHWGSIYCAKIQLNKNSSCFWLKY